MCTDVLCMTLVVENGTLTLVTLRKRVQHFSLVYGSCSIQVKCSKKAETTIKVTQHAAIWVRIFQTELKVEIYSKSLVRAIGKEI